MTFNCTCPPSQRGQQFPCLQRSPLQIHSQGGPGEPFGLPQYAGIGQVLAIDLPRPRDRLKLAEDHQYNHLRSQVLAFLYQRQMRPQEAA